MTARWTAGELDVLRAGWASAGVAELARRLGRTPDAVDYQARNLGLKGSRAKSRRFRPGDRVEFRSGDRGGCWKSGVVEWAGGGRLRIRTGPGVWVVRPARKCRPAETAPAVLEDERDG